MPVVPGIIIAVVSIGLSSVSGMLIMLISMPMVTIIMIIRIRPIHHGTGRLGVDPSRLGVDTGPLPVRSLRSVDGTLVGSAVDGRRVKDYVSRVLDVGSRFVRVDGRPESVVVGDVVHDASSSVVDHDGVGAHDAPAGIGRFLSGAGAVC